MGARVKLKFSQPDKLLQSLLTALSQGKVNLPAKKQFMPGEKIELEIILPEVSDAPVVQVQVESQTPDLNKVKVLVLNQQEVERFLDRLMRIPSYNELLKSWGLRKVPIEEAEELVLKGDGEQKEEFEESEVILKLETPGGKEVLEVVEKELESEDSARTEKVASIAEPVALEEDLEPILEKSTLPPEPAEPEVKIERIKPTEEIKAPKHKKSAIIREEIHRRAEKIPKQEGEKFSESAEPKIKAPEPSEPSAIVDPFQQLKEWLAPKAKKEKEETPTRKKEAPIEIREPVALSDYAPVGKFLQSLVKAMLRSGYYSPDHPGSQQAKQGLYQEFKNALEKHIELGLMLQHRPGQAPEFLVMGISQEPITLRKLLGAGTAELFVPKYIDYFERKRLINLTIKNSITEDHFYQFVDIMSDPTVDKGEASEQGRLLTRMLVDNNITEISTIFEDDLIMLESRLPWRVEMAIQRLAKDLKVLPLFKDIAPEELRQMKSQIVHDILRPLRRPELLKDIILNVYLITRQVPGIDQEELEEAVIQNFPINMLIPTSEYIFQELKHLKELKPENEEQKSLILSRIDAIKGILKKIAVWVLMEEVPEADSFLEQIFYFDIIPFEELPPQVQDRINTKRMTEQFQKEPYLWLGKFSEAKSADEMELFLKFFQKIVPLLLERKDYQSLFIITESLSRIPKKKLEMLAPKGITDPYQIVWGQQVPNLLKLTLESDPNFRAGVEEIFLLLGEFGIQKLYDALLLEKDSQKRKYLIEALVKFGPKSLDRLRAILKDPARQAHLQLLALEAIGRAKDPKDADLVKIFLRHSRPELRAEAITALVRILEENSVPELEKLALDMDFKVRKRWIAAMGFLCRKNNYLRSRLEHLAFNEEEDAELRAQAFQELTRNPPEDEGERKELQSKLLALISQRQSFGERLKKRFKGEPEEQEKIKVSVLDLLGKIGDSEALQTLSQLKFSGKELNAKLEEVLRQMRLRISAKK